MIISGSELAYFSAEMWKITV